MHGGNLKVFVPTTQRTRLLESTHVFVDYFEWEEFI